MAVATKSRADRCPQPFPAQDWGVPVFLLSPAYCAGKRAQMLLREDSEIPLARALAEGSLSLGAAFSFLSGLYFRGKLAYAGAFATPEHGTFIITPTRGLQPPHLPVSAELLREFAAIDVDLENPRYRLPLERDVRHLARQLAEDTLVVLLGSIATGKYVDLLEPYFGHRLHYPTEFIGRGDMSRGALLLRSAGAGRELHYTPITSTRARTTKRVPVVRQLRMGRRT